jgi:integrase/recombinase XerD
MPLPWFLDDAAATKLMRASRADPDPLSRLIVELLARTGIRRTELRGLTVDAVVQNRLGRSGCAFRSASCTTTATSRCTQLKDMLHGWITHHRPTGLRSQRLLIERSRPISALRVSTALSRSATTPASATSPPTSSATPSRPRRSTAA